MSKLRLRLFDGTRQPFPPPAQFLVTIIDGNQKTQVSKFFTNDDLTFVDLPGFDGAFGDHYRVVVSTDGHRQAGYAPLILSEDDPTNLDLMLVPKNPGFSFFNASYAAASSTYPFLAPADTSAAAAAEAKVRYDDLLDKTELKLACLLNLAAAMKQILLAQGTPVDYLRQLRWDPPFHPAQDRFFAWCDPELLVQVRDAASAGQFDEEANPGLLHPGGTRSWKQNQLGEANVQLTFHENEPSPPGTDWLMVEPDMDYFKSAIAHGLLEVVRNAITHTLTDPVEVYVLRWIAGRHAGVPEFAPLYTIT
jgi:hypothetical protein